MTRKYIIFFFFLPNTLWGGGEKDQHWNFGYYQGLYLLNCLSLTKREAHSWCTKLPIFPINILPKLFHYLNSRLVGIVLVMSKMEVVLLSITNDQENNHGMSNWSCGGILAKVLRLVLAPKSLGLNLRSRASGKLFVEIYYALHLGSIRRRPDGLNKENSQLLAFTSFHVFCFFLSLSRKLLPICWISARVCSRSH